MYYNGVDTSSANGLDSADRYRVTLWPGEPTEPLVRKAYAGDFAGD
jgi:hypothetical protein